MASQDPADTPRPAAKNATGKKAVLSLDLDDLIVHNYSERDILIKKADKLTRSIINDELRQGEAMRTPRLGYYEFFFPKLTPAAAALRCAVLADQVAREVRKLNPTLMAMDARRHETPETESRRAPRRIEEQPSDDDMREAASRAFARMGESAGDAKDLTLSANDKAVMASLAEIYCPVWHSRNKLITGYNCGLTHDGKRIDQRTMAKLLGNDLPEVITAKLDVALYERAANAIQYLLSRDLKALLIVPIHFSTIDRLRFIGPLLQAGAGLPPEAKNLMVFEITNLPPDLSRFRLREPVNYLKTHARALIARCGFATPDLEGYKELAFHGMSVDLRDYDWVDSKLFKAFDLFAAAGDKYRLQSFVHGISSTTQAVAAVAAGFSYIEGSSVAEGVTSPAHIRPFEIDMLFEG